MTVIRFHRVQCDPEWSDGLTSTVGMEVKVEVDKGASVPVSVVNPFEMEVVQTPV